MIKLKDILNELEVGKVLFGDTEGTSWDPRFPDRWNDIKLPYEPNTYDEKKLLDLIRAWITKEDRNPKLGEFLKQLLPLKKKFPIILDPTKGRSVYDGNKFYRGTLLPLNDLIYSSSGWKLNNSVDFQYGAIESKIPYTWEAVGQKGFTSFTPAAETADGFAADYMQKNGMQWVDIVNRLEDGSGMIPVILTIKDTYPDALMNPKVMNLIGGLGEYEILVIGKQINVDSIIIPNWEFIQKAADEEGVDLSKHFKGI